MPLSLNASKSVAYQGKTLGIRRFYAHLGFYVKPIIATTLHTKLRLFATIRDQTRPLFWFVFFGMFPLTSVSFGVVLNLVAEGMAKLP